MKDKYGLRYGEEIDDVKAAYQLQQWLIDQLFVLVLYMVHKEGLIESLHGDPVLVQTLSAILDYMDELDEVHENLKHHMGGEDHDQRDR